jgi:type IV secretion system protein VirB6
MGIQFNGFSAIGQSFESAVSIINSVSSSLASLITPILLTIVAIWIIAYGLATMRGEVQQPIMQMVGRYYRLGLFMACGLSMGVFQGQIVPAVMDLQTGLAAAAGKSMNSMSGMCSGSAANPYAILDCYGSAALALVGAYFNQAVADGSALAIGAALVGVTLYGVIMALEFIEARLMLFLTLALGPIFIVCGAFPRTEAYFGNWLSKLANLIIHNTLIIAYVAMSMGIFMNNFQPVIGTVMNSSGTVTGITDLLGPSGISPTTLALQVLLETFVLGLLGLKIPHLASALTSGGYGGSGAVGFLSGMAAQAMRTRLPRSSPVSGGQIRQG